jgi:hypothetical protein
MVDKGNIISSKPEMINIISGKINYLKMVKGENNDLYLKIKERFDMLNVKTNTLSLILDIWEEEGIEAAMNHFYKKP